MSTLGLASKILRLAHGLSSAILREVRALETMSGPHVPVAAVTVYAHAEDRERPIAAGFDKYVVQPVDPAAPASAGAALAAVNDP